MIGRPAITVRDVRNGVLWLLKVGARWKDLRSEYFSCQTGRRRFQQLARDIMIDRALQVFAEDLRERSGIDLRDAPIDGTFSFEKKGPF